MQYLHMFDTASEFNEEYWGSGYTEPWVSLIEENDGVNFNKTEDEKLLGTPLTFEIIGDGNIVWSTTDGYYAKTIEYKVNDNEWSSITSTSDGTASIPVSSGDTVQFRGNNSTYGPHIEAWNTFCGTTAHFNVKGNIMSLIDSTGFTSLTQLTDEYTFYYLFSDCYDLVDVQKLKLPATALTSYCYAYMFYGCTSLTAAPELPATTLASQCYYGMFFGCTSLTTAPELPATTLAQSCYNTMFRGCTSLTTAPALPATTLANYCYSNMFQGCTNLTTAPELPATALTNGCYNTMYNGCTSLVVAPELPAMSLADRCYYNMFFNCTSLTTAPELPATTLASYCYQSMFQGCTSLTTAPALPATTLVSQCYNSMFWGCRSLNYIKAMFTTTPGSYTSNWVNGVASTGTFVKNSAADWTTTGVNGIPTGWTVETASS